MEERWKTEAHRPDDPPRLRLRLPEVSPDGLQTRTVLTVATPPDPDVEFLKSGGEPVWPVCSAAELEMLGNVVRLFGGRLVEVEAAPGTLDVPRDELVVGVGKAGEEAPLYAHLTRRRSLEVKSIGELSRFDVPAVVLLCGPEVDREVLQWVSLLSYGRQAPGIVWGRDPAELHMQVLSSSCAAALNGPTSTPHLAVRHSYRAGIRALRGDLSAGAGVLDIAGHGDGVSQGLGEDGALCQRPAIGTEYTDRGPECAYSGFCKVVKKPVREALASGALIPPNAIAARVVVDSGCHGASWGREMVDPGWTMFPALVSNPLVGAVLAVPELSIYVPGMFDDELITALKSGEPVGVALAHFEENPTVQELGYRFVLFGVPAVCAVPPGVGAAMIKRDLVSRQSRPSSPPKIREASLPGLGLLRQIGLDVKAETKDEGTLTSQALLAGVGELEAAAKDEAIRGEIGSRIRTAALAHLATTKVRLFEAWERVASIRKSDRLVSCPYCGWRNHPRIVTLGPREEREFRMCPYCSDVEDAPLPRAASFSLQLPRIGCRQAGDPETWTAAVYVVRSLASQTLMIPWPRDGQGSPLPSFDLEAAIAPAGPARVYAVSIDGIAIHSTAASCFARSRTA